ncbi:MAG TPA: GTPase HflX, partial [Calditrichia bacterium]|nr:GTPase HflX [Calditrichia bacterium]
DRQRQTRRQSREKVFRAALVGYTNVGKSTIMNLMTGSDVLVQNQLFATLDSTVRRVQLDTQHEILLSDTVGFIRKLPHHLVASFQSTLDEVFEADLLVHVVDGSHPNFRDHIETVNGVIKDLGAAEKPQLLVFNKIDLIDSGALPALKQDYPDAVFISAARSIRTNRLKEELTGFVLRSFRRYILTLPVQHAGLVSRLYQYAVLEEPHYEEDGVTVVFQLIPANLSKIEQLLPEGARIEEHPEQNGEPRIHNSEAEA